MQRFSNDDLGRILRDCAGEADAPAWDEDVLDTAFTDLGYDSIAILETTSRIQQEFGIRVEDEAVADLDTPRAFLEHVNDVSAAHSE